MSVIQRRITFEYDRDCWIGNDFEGGRGLFKGIILSFDYTDWEES